MINSMTGFGKGAYRYNRTKIIAEIKTVNHRFFEFSARLPGHVAFLEDKIRAYVNTKVKRGKVNLNLMIEGNHGLEKSFTINKAAAKRYYKVLSDLRKELRVKEDISLNQLMLLPEVTVYQPPDKDLEKIWFHIKNALDSSLSKLVKARRIEGAALKADLSSRIVRIERLVKDINIQAPGVVLNYKKVLDEKIRQIAPNVRLEPGRLETEVAIFAKNCDISEELTRLSAHIKNFKAVIGSGGEAGRRLDFIAQELFREINTIGAKAQDIKISGLMISVKEQIEKIREQVQNVE